MLDLQELRREAMAALRPPAKLDLAEWIEANVHLPASIAAHPGRMRLWPHQVDIAHSMGDPTAERVTILKSARVGYTNLMVAALGHFAVNDPGPVLCVLPADADCRTLMTGTIEPTFAESPVLRTALTANVTGRDNMLSRRFAGGSLLLVSARAPRNLRGHTARVLLLDEIDAFEVDVRGEGDPVALAERRTATFANRRIIAGSTPVHESTSRIVRAYQRSDQRVFEPECPACGERHEVRWTNIRWPDGQPEAAHWACPSCGGIVEDADKPAFIASGRWRATRPEVIGHHGYRLSALISALPNAAWPRLAAEFLEAKKAPETLQTFVNTVLGEPWRESADDLDEGELAARAEPFSLNSIPADVLFISTGTDVQDDRLETVILGHSRTETFVLDYHTIWGRPGDDRTWRDLDDLLRSTWDHPHGGRIGVDAGAVDAGDGEWMDRVQAFCAPRFGRRIVAIKGAQGNRPIITASKSKGSRLFIIGVDGLKATIMGRLKAGRSIRFSYGLPSRFFDELTSEHRVTRYVRGQPTRLWERIPGKRAEALDGFCYALAARALVTTNDVRREEELKGAPPAKAAPRVIKSAWMDR